MTAPVCPTCTKAARLTDGREVYPHRPDLHGKPIWKCDGCSGYVGCHPGTTEPLGTPANAELRKAREHVHALLDPIWQQADQFYADMKTDRDRKLVRRLARVRVYEFLTHSLGITADECHVGMFEIERCRKAWKALHGVDYGTIRAWARQRRAA